MKIKYRLIGGEVIAWGPMPDLLAGSGEAVEDVSEALGDLTGKIRVKQGEFREKNQTEKDFEEAKKKREKKSDFSARMAKMNDAQKQKLRDDVLGLLIERAGITAADLDEL